MRQASTPPKQCSPFKCIPNCYGINLRSDPQRRMPLATQHFASSSTKVSCTFTTIPAKYTYTYSHTHCTYGWLHYNSANLVFLAFLCQFNSAIRKLYAFLLYFFLFWYSLDLRVMKMKGKMHHCNFPFHMWSNCCHNKHAHHADFPSTLLTPYLVTYPLAVAAAVFSVNFSLSCYGEAGGKERGAYLGMNCEYLLKIAISCQRLSDYLPGSNGCHY